jgi:hypothetical protein
MPNGLAGQDPAPAQQAGTITVLNGPNIAAGESLSDGIDCSGGTLVRITMPAPDWTPANMTFQFSSDGNQYNDMFDQYGNEVTLPNMPPGVGIVLSHVALASLVWIKIRSGTRKYPVKQLADRAFALAIQAP